MLLSTLTICEAVFHGVITCILEFKKINIYFMLHLFSKFLCSVLVACSSEF